MDIHAILDLPHSTTDEELTRLLTPFFPATRPKKAIDTAVESLDDDPAIAAEMERLNQERAATLANNPFASYGL